MKNYQYYNLLLVYQNANKIYNKRIGTYTAGEERRKNFRLIFHRILPIPNSKSSTNPRSLVSYMWVHYNFEL